VSFADPIHDHVLKASQLSSSGVDEQTYLASTAAATAADVRAASSLLSPPMLDTLREVRTRVLADEMPVLRLLHRDPLQMHASHLSFQDFFAAQYLCEPGVRLTGTPPWQWPAWWANTLAIGAETGHAFRKGLLGAAGITGDILDLSRRPRTTLGAVEAIRGLQRPIN
jgi:hypothetical protein